MAKKSISWKPKGMNRDMSVSSFSPEFVFENVNLRLATNEGNTMMSWVNEKGTKEITISLLYQGWDDEELETTVIGTTIGTAVIGHALILFTHSNSENAPDRIYYFSYSDLANESMEGRLLYCGNLGFDIEYPLETMVSYEALYIQKVYWTDGSNQPRVINVVARQEKLKKWNAQIISGATTYTVDHFFDFVPTFTPVEESDVTITLHQSSGGLFAPGVIQYCFTYINKYGQQTNIVYVSTIYYLAHSDRGASSEEKVTSSFTIHIEGIDTSFDYVRLYSIQRTSLNDTPIVKILEDMPIDGSTLTYVDSGTTGSTIDPTELLYVGGKAIIACTMGSKDNTLFLGNFSQSNVLVDTIQDYFTNNDEVTINFNSSKSLSLGYSQSVYFDKSNLDKNLKQITTFKGGETYRFGFQLQKADGEWTGPVFLKDATNTLYPSGSINNDNVNLVSASASINLKAAYGSGVYKTFKKVRPLIVSSTIADRTVLCQGVLNPTVFNVEDRINNTPFAQASWFFRPYNSGTMYSGTTGSEGTGGYTITSPEVKYSQKQYSQGNYPVVSKDSNSKFDTYTSYYIMVAYAKEDVMKDLIKQGHLTASYISSASIATSTEVYFTGVIYLTNSPDIEGKVCYAFFSTSNFLYANTESIVDSLYYSEVDSYYLTNWAFEVYSGLSIDTTNNLFYYQDKSSDQSMPYTYKLEFFTTNNKDDHSDFTDITYYVVKFHKISGSVTISDDITTQESSFNLIQASLRFTHYDSIYAASENLSTGFSLADSQVEIQGSKNIYSTPFTATAVTNPKSNTQFFIDQSIVTLNSPDLEFDSEVQSYGTDGLKLRIIGAIPITASASSHSINISSEMLETNYVSDSDDYDKSKTHIFGIGERSSNVVYKNNSNAKYSKRLVSGLLWNDSYVNSVIEGDDDEDETDATKITTNAALTDFVVYPWQRTGSMNNDVRAKAKASSYLDHKRMANIWFSSNSLYLDFDDTISFDETGVQIPLTENAEVMNYKLPSQRSDLYDINYYPNIDKVLINTDGYHIRSSYGNSSTLCTNPISMKYKSTTHAVIALGGSEEIPILPYGSTTMNYYGKPSETSGTTFWGDTLSFSQSGISLSELNSSLPEYGYLWIGELYKDVSNRFGGSDSQAILTNTWIPAGDDVLLTESNVSSVPLVWDQGDTYYQRYDCLKTYPFTEDDSNQVVEILSFMCETHVNIEGRYDRNRGQMDNTLIRPTNFNLLNYIYSQSNNFFNCKKIDEESLVVLTYPNQIYYSKTKESGAVVDLWTNVTLASTLELDGDKGAINSFRRLNDQLIAFQDNGIAQILYNENVQIATTQGVPIELANSGKVQGKRYISDTIGCSNKWAMAQTPTGIYFMDNNNKGIYLFNGQVNDLSTSKGFNSWCKQNIQAVGEDSYKWNPRDFENFIAYYDKLNQDILFIDSSIALAYSEKFACFTSFYDYEGTPYFENLDDTGIWVRMDEDGNSKLYKHQAGDYSDFFDTYKPFSMTLIANQEPTLDKIFTNMEFRATVDEEGTYNESIDEFLPTLPFDSLEAWDEYQHGIQTLSLRDTSTGSVKASLERKFRIWRCDIPRDNAEVDSETEAPMGITRFKVRPLDRMRNPWVYLKLMKNISTNKKTKLPIPLKKTEIHDIMATYFG